MSKDKPDIPVFIYQMGKVGSKTIEASLSYNNVPCLCMHTLTCDKIEEMKKREETNPAKSIDLQVSLSVRRLIDLTRGEMKHKVITLVREPVSRTISNVFQNMHRFYPHLHGRTDINVVPEIIEILLKRFRGFNEKSDGSHWLNNEMKKVFGLDVFSVEFDRSADYRIYRAPDANILLIKLERLFDCHKAAFNEFLGIENFCLINTNLGIQKQYYPIYKQVKESISIPDEVLDRIYSSRLVRRFYNDKEITDFKKKWSKKAVNMDLLEQLGDKFNLTKKIYSSVSTNK